MIKNHFEIQRLMIAILAIFSSSINSCRKDECKQDGDNLQMDDSGVFVCKKNPSMHGGPTPWVKRFKNVQCDLEGYIVSIENNVIRCKNDQNDLFLGGQGMDNQFIYCPESNEGHWIKIR